jgi:ATP-dependent protease Clp ATPase subunit
MFAVAQPKRDHGQRGYAAPIDNGLGLRSIMEGILLDTMFDLPSLEGVEES